MLMRCNDLIAKSMASVQNLVNIEKEVSEQKNYTKMKACQRTEGRLFLVYKILQNINKLMDEEVRFEAFRLKNLSDWCVPSSFASDLYNYLVSNCGTSCQFCYQKGNPPKLKECSYIISDEELTTRKKFFKYGKGLFPINYYISDEILAHPRVFEILEHLREFQEEPFEIYTNGLHLTEHVIKRLSQLKPIIVYVSLNSSNPDTRRKIMSDKHPEIAIQSLELLKKYQIKTRVSIVADPTVSVDDILDTIKFVEKYDTNVIYIRLPSFTKYSPIPMPENIEDTWRVLISKINEIAPTIKTPILFIPALLVNHLLGISPNIPFVNGVIKGSPAEQAGFQRGDIIKKINGLTVENRYQIINILMKSLKDSEITINISRDKSDIELNMINKLWCEPDEYPFPYSNLQGLLIVADISNQSGKVIKEIIDKYKAQKVLMLTSRLMKERFEHIFNRAALDNIDILIPENNFFGGYTVVGGLWIIRDIIDSINKYIAENGKVDLVIIPSTPFSPWGRDLIGESFLTIEREIGSSVHVLPTHLLHHY